MKVSSVGGFFIQDFSSFCIIAHILIVYFINKDKKIVEKLNILYSILDN